MNKKFLKISTFFILIGCSDGFFELEDRIKIHAEKNGIEKSFFQVKKEALYIQQWSKDDTFIDEINEFKKLDMIKSFLFMNFYIIKIGNNITAKRIII